MPRKVLEQQARQEQTRKRSCEAGKRATDKLKKFVAEVSCRQLNREINV